MADRIIEIATVIIVIIAMALGVVLAVASTAHAGDWTARVSRYASNADPLPHTWVAKIEEQCSATVRTCGRGALCCRPKRK